VNDVDLTTASFGHEGRHRGAQLGDGSGQ